MGGPTAITPINRPGDTTASDRVPAKSAAAAKSAPTVTSGSLAACGSSDKEDIAVFEDIVKLQRDISELHSASARRLGAENDKQLQDAEKRARETLTKDQAQFRDHIAEAFAACPYRRTPFKHADLAPPGAEFILTEQARAQLSAISNEYRGMTNPAVKAAARQDSNYRAYILLAATWLAGSPKGQAKQDDADYKKNLVSRATAVVGDPRIDPDIKQDFQNSLVDYVKRYGVDLRLALRQASP